MRKAIRKSFFALFITIILCGCVIFAGAANGENYQIVITSRSMNVGLNFYTQVEAEVPGLELQPQFEWSSSDETVATVNSSGVVSGKSLGTFEVIATATVNGEELTAKFPMKVVENENALYSYMEQHNLLSFQYSYDGGGYYYANDKKAWQDEFGFAGVYDFLAPYVRMDYDVLRTYFTYEDTDYMIQLWKGQYLLFMGGEIGIYTRPASGLEKDPYTIYSAAEVEDWLIMDMAVYHQKKEGDAPEDYELLFRRPVDRYWWCTGFVNGNLRNTDPADELRTQATLTFKDEAMADLFAKELGAAGLKKCSGSEDLVIDGYYVQGKDVGFSWQNVAEEKQELNWKNVGTFLLTKLIEFLISWGLPELANLLMK